MTLPALTFDFDQAPESSTNRRIPLSRQLWDLDWNDGLPHELTCDGIVVHACDFASVVPFIEAHYPSIFGQDARPSRFSKSGTSLTRRRYYEACGDFFAFRDAGKTVGVLVCTPVDWATYYIRSTAVLPEYQGKALIQRFFPYLFQRLRAAGIERVEADASPANFASTQNLLRQRFHVTGTVLSERWGALVRFTHFLDDAANGVFFDQFCDGVKRSDAAK